jgi:hypothetical protein
MNIPRPLFMSLSKHWSQRLCGRKELFRIHEFLPRARLILPEFGPHLRVMTSNIDQLRPVDA